MEPQGDNKTITINEYSEVTDVTVALHLDPLWSNGAPFSIAFPEALPLLVLKRARQD